MCTMGVDLHTFGVVKDSSFTLDCIVRVIIVGAHSLTALRRILCIVLLCIVLYLFEKERKH